MYLPILGISQRSPLKLSEHLWQYQIDHNITIVNNKIALLRRTLKTLYFGNLVPYSILLKLEQLWKSLHISIATKVKLFHTTCVTILLYGCESWVISKDMENKINAFATSCYRVMLNIKRIDHVLNTTVYSMTNTVPLIYLVRHRQLKFLGHILRMSKEEPARRYALYIPTIGKRRPGRPRTSYLNYVQRLLGDNEGAMQEQQIAVFADDRHAWRNLVVACSAADG